MKTDFKTETELSSRILGYSFLFRSFIAEPSADFIGEIKKSDILVFLPYVEESEDIKMGIEAIESYINQQASIEKLADELSVDYAALFIGAGKPVVPPWESLWLGGERLFSLEETLDVRRYYARQGLLPERLNKEPDDHIGFELQFMYILAEKTANTVESGDYDKAEALLAGQKDFLEKHLLRWSERFADAVYKNAYTDFYKGAAQVLSSFLKTDHAKISDLYNFFKAGGEQ